MKRIGPEKAAALDKSHPGMTLSSWLEHNYTHVTFEKTVQEGSKRLTVAPHNVELTIALLSTDNVVDWAKVAFHWAPAGTIVDKVPMNYYVEKLLLLRQKLTKELVMNPDNKLALRYLTILERRDSDRWAAKQKAWSLKAQAAADEKDKANGPQSIKLEFEIVDP